MRNASINTENHLIVFFDYRRQDCIYTGIITGAYSVFYQGGPIYHCTHVTVPVAQSIAEGDYNAACTSGMSLAHFRMLNNELLNKDSDVVTEQSNLIILNRKSYICMANNSKDAKHTRNISRIIHLVRNGEDWNIHKTVWCEGGLQLEDIWTKNVREYELNTRLGYAIIRLDSLKKTCTTRVTV